MVTVFSKWASSQFVKQECLYLLIIAGSQICSGSQSQSCDFPRKFCYRLRIIRNINVVLIFSIVKSINILSILSEFV